MEVAWTDHSGHKHAETFDSPAAVDAHLRTLEEADKRELAIMPTASGRITIDRWHKMRQFRLALGLPEHKYAH